ncbi:hypothetical protein DP939_09325 [Spongiactinospora rosea]|uniref:Uncharacterized protein n=1 Tax=Spongiactinospora rosea TaxID=2248750 RepID=A0A366M3L4_9ACTN|nr:hypothetical protein [Spongiactinospora rosea]RBQ20022.1 hypothetical protein DP939_09325 [Spongiactinospora rosea]
MSHKWPVESALDLATALLGEAPLADFHPSGLIALVRRFSEIEFDVPNLPDVDGYLLQYGKVGWFSEPTFVLSLARQLELVGPAGEHDAYIQVQFELRLPLVDDLKAVGSYSEWWFPGDEKLFDVWLESIGRAPIMGILADKVPRELEIWQDQV